MNPDELDFFRHLKKERNQNVAQNLIQSLDDRNLGHFKKNVKSKEDRELYAEEELIRKENYDELQCEMPGMPRSTFLMVFSPDGTKVASTHGNHNIYVTDLRSGKNVKTLVGHPRTPWCIAFHPSSNQIVASGCLGGQVRIWDLSGGSEVWTTTNQSVIASIAFHPNDRILVIATINEVYFWDWSKPEPFCHTATGNQKEKVRYVAFDKLGHKLITGISNSQNRWDYVRSSVPITRQSERSVSPYRRRITHRIFNITGRQNSQPAPVNNTSREPLSTVPERERNITMCYRNLVREYGRLVQRYLQLYRPPAMIDRGTDPMEQNSSSRNNSSTQVPELSTSNDPGPSRSDDIGASRSIEPESSRSNDSISSRSNDSGPSRSNDVNNHSSTQNQSTNTNHNPFQLLTPSRILSVMSRPTLIRSTQTTESRKHKTESNCQESSGGKKQKVNISSAEQASLHNTELTKTTSKTNQQAGPSHRSDSPQPGPSRIPEVISEERSDREQVLEDIIKGASAFKIRKDLFEKSESLISSKTGMNSSVASTHDRGDIGVSTLNSSNEARQNTSTTLPQGDSSTISSVSGAILKTNDSHTSPPTSRASSRITLMDFLNKLPKFSKATQKSKSDSGSSSTSEKSDNEQNVPERKSNGLNLTQNEESRVDKESSTQTENEVENLQENVAEGAPIDFSIPGTSRGDTEMTNSPREAQRLELMMMNIRRNAEDKLRSRFLPLIRSVPENVRLELIRVFEQGVKESREKARLRYRNMGQMFNKKQNRRPILDTSSDTTSSDDERDPLHIDFFNQAIENERKRIQGTSNVTGESSRAGPSQGRSESSTADAYHDINNLENWVTSLFDDIEPQGGSNSGTTNLTTAQTSTSVSTSTSISSLLDRPPRSNRVQSIRRIYAKVLRDRVNSRESTNPAPMSSTAAPIAPPNSSVNPVGNTSTRTTNSTIYSLARRRLGTHRASAFLPTRLYYPRTPPEFRRSRQFSFGRWRLNQRPYRSYNMSDILNTSNSGFAVDEVINFSELPNSEDDPIPANDRSSSNTSPNFPYHFHPFNPPPDLPTINPENIGIGNMYSNIVQDLETSLNDVRNIRAANRPGEMTDMLSNFSERLENIMNQSETILRNLRTSVEMLPGNDSSENGPSSSAPTASFNDANFYIRDQRAEAHDLERSIDSILGENPANNVTSDHTYPRNSDSSSPSSSSNTMSPLMTSLHLTISHIQRQTRLLRQQVESIQRIDRAMVEVAQLQLMRLLLVQLSRYVRNMSGESRSTCMSSVRQMMAGTRISDSGPGESQTNDNETVQASSSHSQPCTSNTSSDPNNMPSARTRGITHKTYPPSRLSRLQRQYYRRATFVHHVPRRYALRLTPRNNPNILSSSSPLNLDSQSMLHMYSRINTLTLNRMSRRLDELINEQVRIFTQGFFIRVPPRLPGGNMGEQNLAIRLRDSITRTNRLVGSIFDANVVRNYRMDTASICRDGVDRFYPRQILSFIIDGISSHLDETRGSPLPHNIRLQLQGVMTMSMLLSELLLLHIVDSIPPPTDMNLDQERQSLTNRIDQMCTTMMLNSRYGGYSTHLTHSLRQLQTMIRQNSNQPSGNLSPRSQRRALAARSRALDSRSRALHRMNLFNRMRNSLPPLPSRAQEQSELNSIPEVVPQPSEDIDLHSRDAEITENRLRALRRMRCSLQSLCYRVDDRSNQNQETETRATDESTGQTAENLDLRARALEARTRAFHRMQMMDRMRNSLRSLPRFGEPPEQPHTQNSESDDNTRPTLSNQRRDQQVQGPSSEFGSWQETWNPPSTDRPNEEPRYGDSWTNNEQNTSSDRTFRITPSYRSPSTPNSTAPATSSNSEEWPSVSRWPWNVPSVQVNDVPVSEFGPSQESSESDNPPSLGINNNNNNSYPTRGVMARLAAIRAVNHPLGVFRPRFLHPLYASVNPFDADLDDPQREHIYDSDVITTVTPNHRIQVWDISDSVVPVISNRKINKFLSFFHSSKYFFCLFFSSKECCCWRM
ncbi:hypothetical protein HHI36_006193 [Cryptolaemus montrouzieri]|uniref:Activating molecule in BECN1-regulated autophagy protein 1 n=1 Tax=Cryptolaemus montrouzieri TaxID=559131 RepID=A0ABD2NWM3_9CUCU